MAAVTSPHENKLLGWFDEILAWNHALSMVSEVEGELRRNGRDPHLHRGWELKISPLHSGECRWELVPPGRIHEGSDCFFSLVVTPVTAAWVFERVHSCRFALRERESQLNLLPELLTAAARIAGRDDTQELQTALARTILSVLRLLLQAVIAGSELSGRPNLYEIALHYLQHNYYRKELEVGDVARFVGVSPQYLNKVFRSRTRRGLRQTLIEIRLKRAAELLQERSYLVGDVASLTGWSSPFYFCNSFKKFYGYPPNQLLRNA